MPSTENVTIHRDILNATGAFFTKNNLTSFKLPIPLRGPSSQANKDGIKEKIFKNRSMLISHLNPVPNSAASASAKSTQSKPPPASASDAGSSGSGTKQSAADANSKGKSGGAASASHNDEEMVMDENAKKEIQDMVERLLDGGAMGFVFILAEITKESGGGGNESGSGSGTVDHGKMYRPVAGGVLEYLTNGDRELRALWSRRSLPSEQATEVNQALCLRLISEALLYEPPGARGAESHFEGGKSVSIQGNLLLAFPQSAYRFIVSRDGLYLRPHRETEINSHNDNASGKCKCLKGASLGESRPGFWGINETRFLNQWRQREWASRFLDEDVDTLSRRRRTAGPSALRSAASSHHSSDRDKEERDNGKDRNGETITTHISKKVKLGRVSLNVK